MTEILVDVVHIVKTGSNTIITDEKILVRRHQHITAPADGKDQGKITHVKNLGNKCYINGKYGINDKYCTQSSIYIYIT